MDFTNKLSFVNLSVYYRVRILKFVLKPNDVVLYKAFRHVETLFIQGRIIVQNKEIL